MKRPEHYVPRPKQGLRPAKGSRGRVNPRSKKRGTGSRVPAEVVEEVALRSNGWCECRPGCRDRAQCLHHRLPRSHGGADSVTNLLALSHRHHEHVHANPAESYRNGTLLRSNRGDTPDAA